MKNNLIKQKFLKEKVLKKILGKSDQKIDNKRFKQAFNELLKK